MWMCLPGGERPNEEVLCIELVSHRDCGRYGNLVERNSLMGYRDIIGETNYPTEMAFRSFYQ
jgi:hypothetical protein